MTGGGTDRPMTGPSCGCPRARHEHGTLQMYVTHRCRCRDCRSANAARGRKVRRQAAYNTRTGHWVPAVGTQRRLQALACLGWSPRSVAEEIGMGAGGMWGRVNSGRWVTAETHELVREFFRTHDMTPPPQRNKGERISAARTRRWAARQGFKPPLHWDEDTIDLPDAAFHAAVRALDDITADVVDPVAVELALAGRRVRLTKAERREAARRGIARGMTTREVSRCLGNSMRTVERYKAAA